MSLLTTVCLFALSVGVFNHIYQVAQAKQTGQPVRVLVVAKKPGLFRQPAKMIVQYVNQTVVVSTRSKAFFRNSKVGRFTTVLVRDDVWVAPNEPVVFPFALIGAIWMLVGAFLYAIFLGQGIL